MAFYFTFAEMEKPLWLIVGIVARLCVSVSEFCAECPKHAWLMIICLAWSSYERFITIHKINSSDSAEDREGSKFNLSPEECKKRSTIMWELYSVDVWQVWMNILSSVADD
jgi:hypothetical protein